MFHPLVFISARTTLSENAQGYLQKRAMQTSCIARAASAIAAKRETVNKAVLFLCGTLF
jgi:hypothetical protein